MRPLWLAFSNEAPEIRLPVDQGGPARRRRFRSIGFKLYRRAVEIRDGCFVIRQYLEAGVRQSSEAHHGARGLSGEELNAAVTADQILAGVAARKTGERPHPDQLTDFADTAPRPASRWKTSTPSSPSPATFLANVPAPPTPSEPPHDDRPDASACARPAPCPGSPRDL
ncbi:DUF6545 domain-containing protein [Streptomyces sp. B21-083]|uniref:DUF6545 domain-containing protein n=1 Tax=Streptomyces sp. B21-083 TaxID=3039410 RepID=UPI002FF17238